MGNSLHSARISNRRDLRLFLWYLSTSDLARLINKLVSTESVYHEDDIFGSNVEVASQAINQAIRLIKDNQTKRMYTLDFDVLKSVKIPSSEFSWIKKSPDAAYFTWLFIKSGIHDLNGEFQLDIKIASKIRNERYPNKHDFLYNKLDLNTYPVDNKERLMAVEDFFDRIPMSLRAKLNLMHRIRGKWDELYHLSANFPLSPKSKKKCDWAWRYIQKDRSRMNTRRKDHEGNYTGEINPPSATDYDMLSMLRPSTASEKYMAVKFSFVFFFVKDNFFIQRFKKAWEVHQYRTFSGTRERKASLRDRENNKKSGPEPISVPPIATTLTELAAISNIPFPPEMQPYVLHTSDNEITVQPEIEYQTRYSAPSDNAADGQITHVSVGEALKYMGKLNQGDKSRDSLSNKILDATSKSLRTILQKAMKEGDKDES
ncbi:hypothetical protein [Citrobacter portucalensis]|uniref:hypothetical protein n=1 Tax=Citrobacter portucalensis TaxID=1639133 RepID=UPI002B239176|nr:hypothetical protein [Citrobacter portucalensis]EKM0567749.1 hypothetical protein [Escherichia coli]MEB0981076.1 hypothetical protein [Citrobacter portucalensis]